MPYQLAAKDGKTCVVKKSDGSVVKCHDDREKAVAHLKALYSQQADATVQAAINEFDAENFHEGDEPVEQVVAAFNAGKQGVTTTVNNGVVYIPDTGSGTWTSSNTNLTAHAEPAASPLSFFSEPPAEFQRRYTTVTDDGRAMGLLATLDECHVGFGDRCITAPREADYSHFAVGTVLTSDGTSIPTGVIAIKGGHADIGLDAASARSHYDDAATGIVDVVVGASDLGIWFSGALRPGATPEQVQALRASGVSGDWRLIDGELRLIGICCVNVPGFPKLSVAASATEVTALVAAGGQPLPHPDLCDCKDATQDILDELDGLQRIVADAGLEDMVIEKLASRIPANDDEMDELFSRIDS